MTVARVHMELRRYCRCGKVLKGPCYAYLYRDSRGARIPVSDVDPYSTLDQERRRWLSKLQL